MLTFKKFDITLLDKKSLADRNRAKHKTLSNQPKRGKINSGDDFLSDYL